MKAQSKFAHPHLVRGEQEVRAQSACASCIFGRWCLCCSGTRSGTTETAPTSNRVFVEKGTYVAHEGSARDGALVMLSGVLKLFKSLPDGRTQITGFRFAGDLVSSRRCDAPWHVTVQAVTPVALCRVGCKTIRLGRQSYPELNQLFLELAREEVSSAQDHMLALGRKTPVEKLASFLLEMDRKSNGRAGTSGKIGLPMTRYDIADYLGLENETVSRVFTKLKSMGILDLPQPNVVILQDREAIQCLADGTVSRSMARTA